ncbi:hypothetical protein L207DRAFT_541775 [Hyaloscypha variabilis F]|uniref:MFS general substrate transporter n=1 Tax=Hyaloscypha variabilis (strain UAMH 11265 / GT02V1 / F) TaxID=1149755 RepID=A0A2J6S4X9_HYAVF|nr:hypothetical protein L207DRAFT_541775 [Hyaloscypha variabilis F]
MAQMDYPEKQMKALFNVSTEVGSLGLSLYVLGLAVGPMSLAFLSEYFGRSPIYIVSYGIFLLYLLGIALVQNLGEFLVLRFLCRTFASVTIANLGAPLRIFGTHMKLVQQSPLGICGGFWLIIILTIRETRHSVILARRQRSSKLSLSLPRFQTLIQAAQNLSQTALKRSVIFLFTEAIVQFSVLYNGYLTIDTGFYFLGIFVGTTLGVGTNALFQKPSYHREVARNGGGIRGKEGKDGMIAVVTFPISLFWCAWMSYKNILRPASALAGIGLICNPSGAGFPLFGTQMYDGLGNQGATSLLAGLAVLMVPIPFILRK